MHVQLVRFIGLLTLLSMTGCASVKVEDEAALNKAAGIEIQSTKDGAMVKLPQAILFDFDGATLRPDTAKVIRRSVVVLNRSTKPIQVNGYTDNIGSLAYNQKLSEARARAVANALINQGVDAARIRTKGFASNDPVASNDTEEGRALNRRTELVVLGESVDTLMHPKTRSR